MYSFLKCWCGELSVWSLLYHTHDNKISYGSRLLLFRCFLVCYLVRVEHIRTAVTGISHPIVVFVLLVCVGHSLAVVEDILQACGHIHLNSFISASCSKAMTRRGKSKKHDRTQPKVRHGPSNASPDGSVCWRRRLNSFQWPLMPGGGSPWKMLFREETDMTKRLAIQPGS